MAKDEIGEELATWGKVALLETRGRLTGNLVRSAVGFVEDPDGTILVAAGTEHTDWALNLRHEPTCRAAIGDEWTEYVASELNDEERNATVVRLILKYGTPAERLGRGPAFRLTPPTATSATTA